MEFLNFLMRFIDDFQETLFTGINTGLGIVLGNWIINSFKYRNMLKDVSKVFDLIIGNQIDDLYNIRMACQNINNQLTTNADIIIDSQDDEQSNPQRTTEERRGLLKYTTRIEDLETNINDDELYKRKLDNLKLYKSSDLEILVKYFRKLNVVLEELRNFTCYELPNSIDKFDTFDSDSINRCQKRTNFLIARINTLICLGLMTKPVFNTFEEKAITNFKEVYKSLLDIEQKIQDDESEYTVLKEDFNSIKELNESLSN